MNSIFEFGKVSLADLQLMMVFEKMGLFYFVTLYLKNNPTRPSDYNNFKFCGHLGVYAGG